MRNPFNPERPLDSPDQVDPDSDRFPDFGAVLAKLQQDENLPEGPIERLEIACHASGDATWRVWQPRAEEYIGGFYANSEF